MKTTQNENSLPSLSFNLKYFLICFVNHVVFIGVLFNLQYFGVPSFVLPTSCYRVNMLDQIIETEVIRLHFKDLCEFGWELGYGKCLL